MVCEGETNRRSGRGSKIRLFSKRVGLGCLRLEPRFAWSFVPFPLSRVLFSLLYTLLSLSIFRIEFLPLDPSRHPSFSVFPFFPPLPLPFSFFHVSPLTLLRYHVPPPLSNLTRARGETRIRGATRQERHGTWKGTRLHGRLRSTRLRHCRLESLIGRGLCRIHRGCIVNIFQMCLVCVQWNMLNWNIVQF